MNMYVAYTVPVITIALRSKIVLYKLETIYVTLASLISMVEHVGEQLVVTNVYRSNLRPPKNTVRLHF